MVSLPRLPKNLTWNLDFRVDRGIILANKSAHNGMWRHAPQLQETENQLLTLALFATTQLFYQVACRSATQELAPVQVSLSANSVEELGERFVDEISLERAPAGRWVTGDFISPWHPSFRQRENFHGSVRADFKQICSVRRKTRCSECRVYDVLDCDVNLLPWHYFFVREIRVRRVNEFISVRHGQKRLQMHG